MPTHSYERDSFISIPLPTELFLDLTDFLQERDADVERVKMAERDVDY